MADNALKIRNVGPKSMAWLRQVGIRTQEDLIRLGPVEVFLKIKRAGFKPSLNLLYALAGAVHGCHWTHLPEGHKQELLISLDAAEASNPIHNRWDKASARSAKHDGSGEALSKKVSEEEIFEESQSSGEDMTLFK